LAEKKKMSLEESRLRGRPAERKQSQEKGSKDETNPEKEEKKEKEE